MRLPGRRSALLAGALAAVILYAPVARGSQHVALHATLTPERLGQPTTVGFGIHITTPQHEVPPAMTELEILYPAHLGLGLSELGLTTCTARTLEYFGPHACPTNSLMGSGVALAEIQFGPLIIREKVQITIFHTETNSNALSLLINAEGVTPVFSAAIFPSTVLPAPAPYGGQLSMGIPLDEVLPGAPDIAVVQFHATIGPLHLHYRRYIHGHMVTFTPRGIPLPNKCPHLGFKFAAKLIFQDGTHSNATTTVSCPTPGHPRRSTPA